MIFVQVIHYPFYLK